jgi:ribonuclease BN (tRNA processing enzyme)
MKGGFSLTFCGVRGSYPVPGKDTRRYGGNTASLLLELAGRALILDAGTGIIQAGRRLGAAGRQRRPIHVFLTHLHSDHIIGLPFFAPMYDPRAEIVLHFPEVTGSGAQQALEALFLPPYSPITLKGIKARLRFEPLRHGSGRVLLGDGIEVAHMLHDSHPRLGVLVYRVSCGERKLVYATDVESPGGFSAELRGFSAGADLLVHDSQYFEKEYARGAGSRRGYGHSTVAMAARNADICGARRLFLFHFDPTYSDAMLREMLAQARRLFARTFLAQEGKTITIRR